MREKFRNLKYRRKLNLVFFLVGLLPVGVMTAYMIYGFRDILLEREYESMQVSLEQACEGIDQQVEIYNNLLSYSVFDYNLQKFLETEQTATYQSYNDYVNFIDPILNTPKFYHSGVNRMTIYSENIKIPHDVTLAPLDEISGRDWYEKLAETSGEIWVWPEEGREEILAIRRFPGYWESEAYLGLYCDVASLTAPLGYFNKEGAGLLLVDEEEKILYSSDKAAQPKTIREIEENYTYMEQKLDNLPLHTYIYMEKNAIYAEFYGMLGQILLMGCMTLGSIILISRYMSRMLVRRIEYLTTCVNRVDAKDMVLDIEDNSSDEVGVLIRSFRKMLEEIQRLVSEVYQGKIIQQELEMQALQAQINPHFLYNTLSLINWKAISVGEEDISKVTLALSDYYRTTLNKGETFITVEGEVLNIKAYLEIQLMMHDYEFEVEYHIDESLKSYWMPKLILQPLVENALEHGLDVKEEGEKRVIISCRQDNRDMIWIVQDTGVGMEESMVHNLVKTHTTGYGVRNVSDRLVLLYGENYVLHIESCPDVGTTVEIHIPKENENGDI